MLTAEKIAYYVETLTTNRGKPAGEDLKRKTRKALEGMQAILLLSGHDEPDASDYAEYRRQSEANDTSKDYQSTHQNVERIERYFRPKEERSEQLSMIPEEELTEGMKEPEAINTGADDGASTEITAPNEPESLPEAEPVKGGRKTTKNKGGRKPLDENGETRSEKMTAYFTPSMADNIRLWCDWTGISYGDLTVKLFGAFLKDKGDMLNDFRKSREEAKRMNDAQ